MADKRREAAKRFAAAWKGRGYEKGDCQPFWMALLRDVYGVEHPEEYIRFEEQVRVNAQQSEDIRRLSAPVDHTSFIDGYIAETRVMIEQKSLGKDLSQTIKQSDGSQLTPFQQAKRYVVELPVSQHPRYVITCNFAEFWVYDMEKPSGEPEKILLKNLADEYYRLDFLVDKESEHLREELAVSVRAGEIVGMIYDAFAKEYINPASARAMRSLNILCVRIVFCLYAEDSGLFGDRGAFRKYLSSFDIIHMRRALIDLFKILETPLEERDPYIMRGEPLLASFPYVNGGLFANEDIEVPVFTEEIRRLLIEEASEGFDWSKIGPTIFGAVFESTLNPETRRSGGMHYTSVENIHKVLDPLFLNDLKTELKDIKSESPSGGKTRRLKTFQRKLASLTFLDPACGSGNFLTEAYVALRRLENEVLREFGKKQIIFADVSTSPIMVSLNQFYGIEINDFAVAVARTALWIAENQLMHETETIVQMPLDYLPLKSYANIVEANALTIDWETVVAKDKLTYIMGNPPFVGARLMSAEQKQELNSIFAGWKNAGNLDYVCCWYKKAADFMTRTKIRAALVSTNSVAQGESVANLWKPLFEKIHFDFAYHTFRWDSETHLKARVHCVVIGFSTARNNKPRIIYYDDREQEAKNINGYLVDADNVFIERRTEPLCDVPPISVGNQPIDGGHYILDEEEARALLDK
ncbi:MAG: N-6 DNA methylase [Prevotella sp.]|nr:N-6 DNA methylase [Prevotella sp.]